LLESEGLQAELEGFEGTGTEGLLEYEHDP
jgi:hypothetical protein